MARFYESPRWKHVVTTRLSETVTDLSRLAQDREFRFQLGGPCTLTGTVPSADFRVAFPWSDQRPLARFDPFHIADGAALGDDVVDFPRLDEGSRYMYSFRREGAASTSSGPWVVRHSGIVLELEDSAETGDGRTRFVVCDPWEHLYKIPLLIEGEEYGLPGPEGVSFPAGTPGNEIALELLRRYYFRFGPLGIDGGTDWEGTSDYGGTIETTPSFVDPVVFPRGTSLGEAWEMLVDTGTMDIVLTPIYDPLNRPSMLCEVNVFACAGGTPEDAYANGFPSFRWDRTGRSIINIARLQEGRERANFVVAFAGGSGAADNYQVEFLGDDGDYLTPESVATWEDSTAQTRYGDFWLQKTYNRTTYAETVDRLSRTDLWQYRRNLQTWRVTPTPEFSPRPFQDYDLGSYLGLYHSARLREERWLLPENFEEQVLSPRVAGFTLALSNDSLETVTELDITFDNPVGGKIT